MTTCMLRFTCCSTASNLKGVLAQVGHQAVGVGLAVSRGKLVIPGGLQQALQVQVEPSLAPRPLRLVALRHDLCAPRPALSLVADWLTHIQEVSREPVD